MLYTINDFCKLFSISRTTFYLWVKSGYVKVVKIGERTRVTQEEVERLKKGV